MARAGWNTPVCCWRRLRAGLHGWSVPGRTVWGAAHARVYHLWERHPVDGRGTGDAICLLFYLLFFYLSFYLPFCHLLQLFVCRSNLSFFLFFCLSFFLLFCLSTCRSIYLLFCCCICHSLYLSFFCHCSVICSNFFMFFYLLYSLFLSFIVLYFYHTSFVFLSYLSFIVLFCVNAVPFRGNFELCPLGVAMGNTIVTPRGRSSKFPTQGTRVTYITLDVVCFIILAVFLLILFSFMNENLSFGLRAEKSTQSLMRWWSVSCVTLSPCSSTTIWSATIRAAVRAPVAVVTAAMGPTWTAGSEANVDQEAHTTSCALHAGESTWPPTWGLWALNRTGEDEETVNML